MFNEVGLISLGKASLSYRGQLLDFPIAPKIIMMLCLHFIRAPQNN